MTEFTVASMMATSLTDMNFLHCHDRWVLPNILYTYGEPGEDDGTWAWLRDHLIDGKKYAQWRQQATRLPEHADNGSPEPFASAEYVEGWSPIYEYHARKGTIQQFIDAMPLEDDPADFDGIDEMSRTWYRANQERCDSCYPGADTTHAAESITQEEQWVTIADKIKLQQKLEAKALASDILRRLNADMKGRKVGALTMGGVAAIGCVYRKNILKQNGEVPVSAIEQFFARSNTFGKPQRLHHLQIGAARDVLIACEFMSMVRGPSKAEGRCAVFKLLNQESWS